MTQLKIDFAAGLAFVIPVFNEAENLEALADSFATLWQRPDVRVIFVDDGSRDGTASVLEVLCSRNDRYSLVRLSRNFGKEQALAAGLDAVPEGFAVVAMDGDGQHTPQAVSEMLAVLAGNPAIDICFGVRRDRLYQSQSERIFSELLYRILNFGQRSKIDSRVGDFYVARPQVVAALRSLNGHRLFWKGYYGYVGFNQHYLEVDIAPRGSGQTKFNLINKLRLATDGIVTVTKLPLRLIALFGAACTAMSLMYLLIILIQYLLVGATGSGFFTIVGLQLFFGGSTIFVLGIIAEYIAYISEQLNGKPSYIVRDDDPDAV